MREIKFRVWSSAEKEYLDDDDYVIYKNKACHLDGLDQIIKNGPENSTLVLEQYTGLKDIRWQYYGDRFEDSEYPRAAYNLWDLWQLADLVLVGNIHKNK